MSPARVTPLSPDEVASTRVFPDEVIEVFNEALTTKWDGGQAVVFQEDIVNAIMLKKGFTPEMATATSAHSEEVRQAYSRTRRELFDKRLLDIEPLYMALGWAIDWDKPAYNENYRARWTFKRATKRNP